MEDPHLNWKGPSISVRQISLKKAALQLSFRQAKGLA